MPALKQFVMATIYFEIVHYCHAKLGSDICPHIKSLHTFLFTAHSCFTPSRFMTSISCLEHSFPIVLHLPLPHPIQPLYFWKLTPDPLGFLSLHDNPHIHHTISPLQVLGPHILARSSCQVSFP